MKSESPKDYLLKKFPPKVQSLEDKFSAIGIWDDCTFEEAKELSNKVIELFKERDMTYTDAYAMLGFVRMDLDYRSERMSL